MTLLKKLTTLLVFYLISITGSAEEFEGSIVYRVKVIPNYTGVKVGKILKLVGKTHTFYYKNGAHRWSSTKAEFEGEWRNPAQDPDHIYSRFVGNDTLIKTSVVNIKDTLDKFEELGTTIVLGKVCHGASITMMNQKKKATLVRIWYCPSSGTEIDPTHFVDYYMMGTKTLVEHFKRLPYKIIIANTKSNYTLVYEAIEVNKGPLDDAVFQIDLNAPIKIDS